MAASTFIGTVGMDHLKRDNFIRREARSSDEGGLTGLVVWLIGKHNRLERVCQPQ